MPAHLYTAGNSARAVLTRFVRATSGATAVEYAVIAVVIGVPVLLATSPIRTALVDLLGSVANAFVTILGGGSV